MLKQNNGFVQFVHNTASLVSKSISLRIILYLTVSLLIAACTILDLVSKTGQLNFNNLSKVSILCIFKVKQKFYIF